MYWILLKLKFGIYIVYKIHLHNIIKQEWDYDKYNFSSFATNAGGTAIRFGNKFDFTLHREKKISIVILLIQIRQLKAKD